VGIFIIAAWGVPDCLGHMAHKKRVLTGLAAAALLGFGLAAWTQAAFWKNSITFYRHSVDVSPDNFTAWCELGQAKAREGDLDGAISCYGRLLQILPQNIGAMEYIGMAYMSKGRNDLAENWYRRALALAPNSGITLANIGEVYRRRGRLDPAVRCLEKSVEIGPQNNIPRFFLAQTRCYLAQAFADQGRLADAVAQVQKALEIDPDFAAGRNMLSVLTERLAEKNRSRITGKPSN
jgi:tetratricopeptide (TPR) repeat protein